MRLYNLLGSVTLAKVDWILVIYMFFFKLKTGVPREFFALVRTLTVILLSSPAPSAPALLPFKGRDRLRSIFIPKVNFPNVCRSLPRVHQSGVGQSSGKPPAWPWVCFSGKLRIGSGDLHGAHWYRILVSAVASELLCQMPSPPWDLKRKSCVIYCKVILVSTEQHVENTST